MKKHRTDWKAVNKFWEKNTRDTNSDKFMEQYEEFVNMERNPKDYVLDTLVKYNKIVD